MLKRTISPFASSGGEDEICNKSVEYLIIMTGLEMVLIAVAVLAVGYFGYAKWLEKTWGIDLKRPTPAVAKNDGKDFAPASRWTVFAHQFTSITGAGPVTGPIIAAMFGWLPALLWMLVGGVFFGAVQDFTSLYASVKNGGRSIGMIIEDYVGRTGRRLFLFFCWLFTLLVIAAFCDMVANTFNGYSKTGTELVANAAAASTSLIYMAVAVVFGLYLKYCKPSSGVQFVVGVVLMIVMLTLGYLFPVYADMLTWRYVVFAYLFAASVMPMWLLKTPRDYLSMFLLMGVIVAGVLGVCIENPTLNMPAFTSFTVKGMDLFPILFVTIACGAVSGFHSLVSTGTSSKMIASEGDMRLVGYGSMCIEVILGIVSLVVVCAAANNGTLPAGTPFQTFSHSVAAFLTTIFGVPHQIATYILTMCVSALALTSVDAVARIGRMSLQELFTPSAGEEKNAVQKLFTNTVFATVLTLVCGYALCIAGYMSVWPLFGSANQLLSALVLTGCAVFLKSTGRKGWMLYVPMTVMFCVTMTALVEQIIKIFHAWQAGTFVVMVHGLQLVVAAALIILAVLVVYHCVLKLKDAAPVVKRD